jgi:hypothetical protein
MEAKADIRIIETITVGDFVRWFGVCSVPGCNHVLPPIEQSAVQYFESGTVECPGCHARVDLWECARSRVNDSFPPEWGLQGLGAQFTLVPIEVIPGSVIRLDLTQHGVPDTAVILYSNYQADDARALLFPIEFPTKEMARRPSSQALYCMPLPGQPLERGPGRGTLWWLDNGTDAAWSARLANAFRDVAAHDFAGATVEAFSAFEISLFSCVARLLDLRCSSQALRASIERRLSAFAMMEELVPAFCRELGVPMLRKEVVEALHRLRMCRNRLLHRDAGQTPSASEVGEFLAAALIGVSFGRYLESRAV